MSRLNRLRDPEAEGQTDLRRAIGYWIGGLPNFKNRPPTPKEIDLEPAVLLVRSPAEPRWHGLRADVPSGRLPSDAIVRAMVSVTGSVPRTVDAVGVLQPGEYEGITHTTFVEVAMGVSIGNGIIRSILPGVEARLFPLQNMPIDEMPPAESAWVSETLQDAFMSDRGLLHVEIAPNGQIAII